MTDTAIDEVMVCDVQCACEVDKLAIERAEGQEYTDRSDQIKKVLKC
jgi:hypothetical protein